MTDGWFSSFKGLEMRKSTLRSGSCSAYCSWLLSLLVVTSVLDDVVLEEKIAEQHDEARNVDV